MLTYLECLEITLEVSQLYLHSPEFSIFLEQFVLFCL